MKDADKVFDNFCCDKNKQRKPFEIIYGLKMTFNDHAFFKDQKAESKANIFGRNIRTLKIFSILQLFTSNIKLESFSSWHAASETTKFMPASAVYTVSTIQ